ncbi:MAG TPA: histidine--tRNA ligase [Mycobacteriales bacterium]|jgi:histidyl-tRNA synthetase
MAKPTPLSGFPEWLPDGRIVELKILDTLRRAFELHGFASLETRAVEPLDQLLRKGEIDKEVYVLRRLQAEAGEDDSQLGLHFDLTVPFARYVLENSGKLHFPFRRYQIQKVWRGERPQEGRFREFTQADIDIVGQGELGFHHEVELPLVMADALAGLPIPPIRMQVNNRKLVEGFYRGLGITDTAAVLRTVDKLDKIGPARVHADLVGQGLTDTQAARCLELAEISAEDGSFADRVRALGSKDPLLDEGLEELTRVVEAAREHAPGLLVADLRIARGLDYYTGTVYETQLVGHEALGSICSGGRYDDLATAGTERYPGVGLSVGVSRLVSRLLGQGLLRATRSVPTAVLVALPSEETRADCDRVATALRRRGIPVEVAPAAQKYGKQIRYAERRGIPYVWFPQPEGGHEVRDIRSGEQVAADPAAWTPPAADLYPEVTGGA